MTPRALLLITLLVGCAASTEPAATPEPQEAPPQPAPALAPESTAPEGTAPESTAGNPCDKLDPQVFDVADIDARTDLSEAQKEQAKRDQAERRRILFECFQRAMKEKEELEQKAPPAP
ncbi:MAG TPA: hypothetical protein VFB62_14805 [Polyangiaceae bacterium]|jgi:hypothetical protein|nr:hypothetical protein [Polyangiaceae bacterium]